MTADKADKNWSIIEHQGVVMQGKIDSQEKRALYLNAWYVFSIKWLISRDTIFLPLLLADGTAILRGHLSQAKTVSEPFAG